MSVRLIAKRRLAFRGDDDTFVTVMPGAFETCPDWIKKDPLYRWAVEDGTIQVADEIVKAAAKVPEKVEEPAKKPAPAKKTTTKKATAKK